MKILILASNDVYAGKMIGELAARNEHEILVLQTPVRQGSNILQSIKNIIGTSGFDYTISMVVEHIYFEFIGFYNAIIRKHPAERITIRVADAIKLFKIKSGNIKNVNEPSSLATIAAFKPDIILTLYFNQILKKDVLSIPSKGAVNFHPSLLPSYRGAEPYFWVLAEGEKETGITFHYIDQGLDSGDIIAQIKIPIYPRDSVHSLNIRCMQQGSKLLVQVLEDIANRKVHRIPQDFKKSRVYSFVTRKSVKMLRKKHKCFIWGIF